ncbi:MAG: FAD binding domain-containing protein [Candidatus Dormibacteria bacterium]
MIPASFDYVAVGSLEEAVSRLGELGDEAKVLAGGHSLVPLMRLRLARPTALVDITRIPDLDYVRLEGDRLLVGALTRHATVARSEVVHRHLPLLAEMASQVGDPQVRSRGTIGGVMAHADPAGDFPTLALMLEAEIVTDRRRIAAADFFQYLFTTPLEPDEVVREIAFPVASGRHAYLKFRRRLFDWAILGLAVQELDSGWRVGVTNGGPTPLRALGVERSLAAGEPAERACRLAAEGLDPISDSRASSEYRLHLAPVLCHRALERAAAPAA